MLLDAVNSEEESVFLVFQKKEKGSTDLSRLTIVALSTKIELRHAVNPFLYPKTCIEGCGLLFANDIHIMFV